MGGDRLDPYSILETLGWPRPRAIQPVAGGWDTAIWRVQDHRGVWALRVFRPEQAPACRREVAAMGAARAAGIPVPDVVAQGLWHDRPALLLSWCPGQPLLHATRARPWRVWALGRRFGGMQARLHAVPAPDRLRQPGLDWIEWRGPCSEPLRARLSGLAVRCDALAHFDYHPLNVMVHRGSISGVLDWANTRAADPRADFALTAVILRLAPMPPDVPRPLAVALARLLELGWRRGYADLAGRPTGLAPFYAWAGAARLRDLAPSLGKPGSWLTRADLDRLERWTVQWQRRAGIAC